METHLLSGGIVPDPDRGPGDARAAGHHAEDGAAVLVQGAARPARPLPGAGRGLLPHRHGPHRLLDMAANHRDLNREPQVKGSI